MKFYRIPLFGFAILPIVLYLGCTPYLLRAGWEEAHILLSREPIARLLGSPSIDSSLKTKLSLVLEARELAEQLGLLPEKSFTYYSEIDRDVLVWVLNASAKTSFTPVTWWFPIVGNVPYKGFFDKQDALDAASHLKDQGYDTAVRPSAAFSTLGWFNDPLLSTVIAFGEPALVNTVIHEIVHNTFWFRNQVPFNETLANVVGTNATAQFFSSRDPQVSAIVRAEWSDELRYAKFLRETQAKLAKLYGSVACGDDQACRARLLKERAQVYATAVQEWEAETTQLKTIRYTKAASVMNNATILAQLVYLDRPERFQELLELQQGSLTRFLESIREIHRRYESDGGDPYALLEEEIELWRPAIS